MHLPTQAWHVAAGRLRRRKTLPELIAGAEWTELYDRRFPGRLAAAREARA